MEVLDDLRRTRALILSSPDATKLDAQLAMFPMDQKEALALAGKWKTLSTVGRLQEQRLLTEKFRDEYAELRAQANRAIARENVHVR